MAKVPFRGFRGKKKIDATLFDSCYLIIRVFSIELMDNKNKKSKFQVDLT